MTAQLSSNALWNLPKDMYVVSAQVGADGQFIATMSSATPGGMYVHYALADSAFTHPRPINDILQTVRDYAPTWLDAIRDVPARSALQRVLDTIYQLTPDLPSPKPVARLHVDGKMNGRIEILDGEHLTPQASPIALYTEPRVPAGKLVGYLKSWERNGDPRMRLDLRPDTNKDISADGAIMVEPMYVGIIVQRPPVAVNDGRPAGWTEAAALEFIVACGLSDPLAMYSFAEAFLHGVWYVIRRDYPEFNPT